MSILNSNARIGASQPAAASGDEEYLIQRSLRFDANGNAVLKRTPGSSGNRRKWTWSAWVKRSRLGYRASNTEEVLFASNGTSDATNAQIQFGEHDDLQLLMGYPSHDLKSLEEFRDVSAWYHFVVACDVGQGTASDKVKMYVNGKEVEGYRTDQRSDYTDQDWAFCANQEHCIGDKGASNRPFTGKMANIHFIDGTMCTPSDFAFEHATSGQWVAKEFEGSYGTTGFWLPFDDNSGTGASQIGDDESGNGNDWTPSNIAVGDDDQADATVDSPSNFLPAGGNDRLGGVTRGNYCDLNFKMGVTYRDAIHEGGMTFSTQSIAADGLHVFGSWALPPTGKWYWEQQWDATTGFPGINSNIVRGDNTQLGTMKVYNPNGDINGTTNATWTTGDWIGCAYDADNGTLKFYKNGSLQTGSHFSSVGYDTGPWYPQIRCDRNSLVHINFGQYPFEHQAPADHKCLCSTNLPDIGSGDNLNNARALFDSYLYTGNGSARTIEDIYDFEPSMVWFKSRSSGYGHELYDKLRGVQNGAYPHINNTPAAEANGLTAFESTGFSVGTNNWVNANSATYIAWAWAAPSTSVNTSKSIDGTSTYYSVDAGFEMIKYSGTGSAGQLGHNLGRVPTFVVVKNQTIAQNWAVYHMSIGNSYKFRLDDDRAKYDWNEWDNSDHGTDYISLGDVSGVNSSGNDYIAYIWADVPGFSKFGKYVGTNDSQGKFIDCGFRPQLLILRNNDGGPFFMIDEKRDPGNKADPHANSDDCRKLKVDTADAEVVEDSIDLLANGFQCRHNGSHLNNGSQFSFMAWAHDPFKTARAR